MNELQICLAQMCPTLGDLEKNRAEIIRLSEKASQAQARLIAFPELALTGYHTGHNTPQWALREDDPFWKPLLKLSSKISILTGFILETPDHLFYNAAAYLENGKMRFLHKKAYLPNYGEFEEGKWFASGDQWHSFVAHGFRMGVLICEESWHLSPAYVLFLQGIDVLFILTNSSAHGQDIAEKTSSAAACRTQNAFYARMLNSFVCFLNRTGEEKGKIFWGGSECIAPSGRIVARANEFKEHLIFLQLHRNELRKARIKTPLRRDENVALMLKNLKALGQI